MVYYDWMTRDFLKYLVGNLTGRFMHRAPMRRCLCEMIGSLRLARLGSELKRPVQTRVKTPTLPEKNGRRLLGRIFQSNYDRSESWRAKLRSVSGRRNPANIQRQVSTYGKNEHSFGRTDLLLLQSLSAVLHRHRFSPIVTKLG